MTGKETLRKENKSYEREKKEINGNNYVDIVDQLGINIHNQMCRNDNGKEGMVMMMVYVCMYYAGQIFRRLLCILGFIISFEEMFRI